MTSDHPSFDQLETALRGLDVLIKATRFYPPEHPALRTVLEQTLAKFVPAFDGRPSLAIAVHREGFLLDETPVGPRNPALKLLSTQLFARHVRTLMLLADLTARDLGAASRCLGLEPQEIQQRGGLSAMFQEACVATIWINEIDLSSILARKEVIEARQEELAAHSGDNEHPERQAVPAPPPRAEQHLEQLLRELQLAASDRQFQEVVTKIPPLLLQQLHDDGRALVIRALLLLCRYVADRQLSDDRRDAARAALAAVERDEVSVFLVESLCRHCQEKEPRDQLLTLLSYFSGKVEKPLMQRLAVEDTPQARKVLSRALVCLGPTAIPVLLEALQDNRWFVVRNAIGILGDIRDQQTTAALSPLLTHDDVRVRRETLRALTKIGGHGAEGTLLTILDSADAEMRRQAILSLGALRSVAAIPALLELANEKDRKGVSIEEQREAIKAIGQIGSAAVVAPLAKILKRRPLWFGSRHDDLRAEAALALGKIGAAEARPLLQDATEDRSQQVARAAILALNRLEKTISHAP